MCSAKQPRTEVVAPAPPVVLPRPLGVDSDTGEVGVSQLRNSSASSLRIRRTQGAASGPAGGISTAPAVAPTSSQVRTIRAPSSRRESML